MSMFIIVAAFMFIPCAFFGMMATSLMDYHAKAWKKWLVGLLVTAMCSGMVSCAMCTEAKWDEDSWNNGYCVCGGEWEFKGGSQYRTSHDYYYSCESCGHVIETSRLMK